MDTPELDIKSLGIKNPEKAGKWIEKGTSKETVIYSFETINKLLQSTPEDSAKPELSWLKKSIQTAYDKTDLKNGKDTFSVEFINHETGENFTNQEGIPIDGLLRFVAEELKKLPKGSPEWKQLKKHARIIYRSSKRFYELPHRMEPSRLVGRIHHEAQLISLDERSTGLTNENWYKAEEELGAKSTGEVTYGSQAGKLIGRLELVLPKHKRAPNRPSAVISTTTPINVSETATNPDTSAIDDTRTAPISPENPHQESSSQPQSIEKIIREINFVNRHTDVKKRAAEMAELQLRNEMRRGSAFNPLNWPRKIGLRIMEQYYRQQYIDRAKTAMIENNNTYLTMNLVRNAVTDANNKVEEERAAGKAKIEQIKTGELIAGQVVKEVEGDLKQMMIKDIIVPVVKGQITNYQQIQEKLREFVETHQNDPQVQAIFGRDKTQYGELAEYFATDLLETGEALKHDLKVDEDALVQLNKIVRINLVNAGWAAETEASFNSVDKAISWVEKHRLSGILINPATIGAAFSLSTFGLMRAAGIGGKAISTVVPLAGALPGALFAAARRNYDLKVDRAAHQTERTYNMQIPLEAPRRQSLENYSYSISSVDELLNGGRLAPANNRLAQREVVIGNDRRGLKELLSLDLTDGQNTNRDAVIRRMAEIKTRLDFSAQHSIDLISFESHTQVEQGRLALIQGLAQARKALREAKMDDLEIAQKESDFTGEWNNRFTQNRIQQDKEFAHYRLRNAAGAAVFGGVTGLAGGLITQEILTQIAHHTGAAELPIIGGLFHKGQTTLEKGINTVASQFGHSEFAAASPSIETFQDLWTKGGSIELGHNVSATLNFADHSLNFMDNSTHELFPNTPKFYLESDGHLVTPEKLDNLPSQIKDIVSGWNPSETSEHSLNQQIQNAVSSGHPETITTSSLKIEVNGDHLNVIDIATGQSTEGHIIADGTIQVSLPDNSSIKLGELQKTFEHAGFTVSNIEDTPSQTIIKDIPGKTIPKNVLENFSEQNMVEKARRLFWHDNNTPMHLNENGVLVGADGKELQLHHFLKNDGTVTLDMSQMVSQITPQGGVNWDLTTDSQYSHLLNDIPINPDGSRSYNNFEFLITPNDAADNAREVIRIPATSSGNFDIKSNSDLHQFFDTSTGKPIQLARFIEVAHIESDGTRTILATSVGKGVDQISIITPPGHTPEIIQGVHKLVATASNTAIELTPLSIDTSPIIPIPFAPRHPLEELSERETIENSYPEGVFPPGTRIIDIIQRGKGLQSVYRPYGYTEGDRKIDRTEGEASLSEIKNSFENTDSVYIILGGAIGDSVISTAYIKGIQQALNKSGKNIPITVVVNQDSGDLYDTLSQGNIKIIKAPRNEGLGRTRSEIIGSDYQTPLIFDFEHARATNPTIDLEEVNKKKMTTLTNLLIPAIQCYNNTSDKDRRYSIFIEELLSLPENSIDPQIAKPTIELPANKDQLYENLATRCGIDTSNPNQIAIMVEGSSPGKRYGLKNWADVITEIRRTYPNYQFNIIYNKNSPQAGYSKEDISNTLTNAGVISYCHLVDGSLMELSCLLERQKLALSNDSGLAHIAGALKNGPKVVMLFLPKNSSVESWVSTNNHIPITLSNEEERNLENVDINEVDENKKLMNKIPPKRVAQKSIEVLGALSTPQQTIQNSIPISSAFSVETTPSAPLGLIEQVNQTLIESSTPQTTFETTPQNVVNYLKTIPLPLGSTIEEANTQIIGDQLNINGVIKTMVGEVKFTAGLSTDPSGMLKVTRHKVDLPFLARLRGAEIEKQITNLHQIITNQINNQIDPTWEVGAFKIIGGKLVFDFRKKTNL